MRLSHSMFLFLLVFFFLFYSADRQDFRRLMLNRMPKTITARLVEYNNSNDKKLKRRMTIINLHLMGPIDTRFYLPFSHFWYYTASFRVSHINTHTVYILIYIHIAWHTFLYWKCPWRKMWFGWGTVLNTLSLSLLFATIHHWQSDLKVNIGMAMAKQ